jgi:hypothetical protein
MLILSAANREEVLDVVAQDPWIVVVLLAGAGVLSSLI